MESSDYYQAMKRWPAVIEGLNNNPHDPVILKLGSPGSAQVTRCRLLNKWENMRGRTLGDVLVLWLAPGRRARQ